MRKMFLICGILVALVSFLKIFSMKRRSINSGVNIPGLDEVYSI